MPVFKKKDDLSKEDFWFASDEWVELKVDMFHRQVHIPEKLCSPAERAAMEEMVGSRTNSPYGRISFGEVMNIFKTEIDKNFMHMKKKDVREWFNAQPSIKYIVNRGSPSKGDHIDGRPFIEPPEEVAESTYAPTVTREKSLRKQKSKRKRGMRSMPSGPISHTIHGSMGDFETVVSGTTFRSTASTASEFGEGLSENDLDFILMDFPDKIRKWTVDDVSAFVTRLDGGMRRRRVSWRNIK